MEEGPPTFIDGGHVAAEWPGQRGNDGDINSNLDPFDGGHLQLLRPKEAVQDVDAGCDPKDQTDEIIDVRVKPS